MNKVFILQNSYLSFGLDARKISQPHKYQLHLIVNHFGLKILENNDQRRYYDQILVTDNFELNHILSLVTANVTQNDTIDIVTNSEETMPVCGQLRLLLGLDTADYSRFYDKHLMKQQLAGAGFINIPKYRIFDFAAYRADKERYFESLLSSLRFPLFAKPTQMYGSINANKIENRSELLRWANAIDSGDYEVDEFIDGVMYHCDSYIKDRKVLFTFVSRNSRPCYDFTIGKMKGTIVLPADHPDAVTLAGVAERTLQHLGMPKAGVTHLEIFKTHDNAIHFVEIAHRSPGCLIPRMYYEHAAIDTISAHFLLQIDPEYNPVPTPGVFAAWACYPKIPGHVVNLKQLPGYLKSRCEIEWHVRVGDLIRTYSQFGRDYTGTVFMTGADFNELYDEFQIVNDLNLCEIEPKAALAAVN